MATITINVCDRCRKELTNRRTLLNLKKAPCKLEVKVLKIDLNGWNASGNVHSFELCDDCANKLAEFLGYSGQVEEENDESWEHHPEVIEQPYLTDMEG